MIRRIIHIDDDKCNGCGRCAQACHEGAISMVNGKARLMRDDYCDGLGTCLPECPTGAITFVEREAAAYDEKAVQGNKRLTERPLACGCPGTHAKEIKRDCREFPSRVTADSRLSQWPIQIKLVPANAPYFEDSELLIAADCTAYAYGNFHNDFIKNRITLIGCPKLDGVDYTEKLKDIITNNNIRNVTAVRMEVPCCGGIESAVKSALQKSGKFIPWQVITISTDGRVVD